MNNDKILELFFYVLPALITGAVAYFAFQNFTKSDENRRRFQLMRENQKQALPLRLQAYERMALFLERINPAKLVLRITPMNDDKKEYENLLIHHIEQELEHNLTQQIYVSDECWTIILNAKNTIIQNIRKAGLNAEVTTVQKFREAVLANQLESDSASNVALAYLKNEVKLFL
jgi:hypothetical protein